MAVGDAPAPAEASGLLPAASTPASDLPAATSPAVYAPPPATAPYGGVPYGGPEQTGSWGGPLSPVSLFDRSAITKTSRVTVLFRYILAFPHFVVLEVVSIAEAFALIAAWFAALFTGQVPDGLYKFIAWVSAYTNRVGGYMYLLTDKWPTFDEDAPYPIAIRFPGPTKLNRAAVLFRVILAIPAAFVSAVVSFGLGILAFPIWLIVLVKGRVPEKIFDSHARVLHYLLRFRAYYFLLTSEQPSGLLADEPPPAELPPPGQYNLEPIPPRGGRGLVITYLSLGPVVLVGVIVLIVVVASKQDKVIDANNKIVTAYNNLQHTIQTPNCAAGPSQLSCLQGFAKDTGTQIAGFESVLNSTDFHGKFSTDVASLKAATQKVVSDYQQLGTVTSLSQYVADAQGPLQTDAQALDTTFHKLNNELLNSVGQGQ